MKIRWFSEVKETSIYKKDTEFTITGFPYDWASIMHYDVDVEAPDVRPKVS